MPPLAVRKMEVARFGVWGHKCGFWLKGEGRYCDRWAVKGCYCCPKHGGQLPVVRAAGKARLRELAHPALVAMTRLLLDPSVDDAVKLRTVRLVLKLNHISDTLPERKRGRVSAGEQKALPAGKADTPELDDAIEALLSQIRDED